MEYFIVLARLKNEEDFQGMYSHCLQQGYAVGLSLAPFRTIDTHSNKRIHFRNITVLKFVSRENLDIDNNIFLCLLNKNFIDYANEEVSG